MPWPSMGCEDAGIGSVLDWVGAYMGYEDAGIDGMLDLA